ncbi:MAG: hypothetical protein NC548_37710 [Lachnospiraceae bacterium]|nr:hypothetical protein [Lachnospiraceae bacterium]
MGNALLVGGGGGGGIREKRITYEAYMALSEADRQNPYIIYLVEDRYATDLGNDGTIPITMKSTVWSVYERLSYDDRMDPNIVWMITDKTPKDLAELGISPAPGNGTSLYNIAAELDTYYLTNLFLDIRQRVIAIEQALAQITEALQLPSI